MKNALMLWNKYVGEGDNGVRGAIELYYATGDEKFKNNFMPAILKQIDALGKSEENADNNNRNRRNAGPNMSQILRVYDMLPADAKAKVDAAIPAYVERLAAVGSENPYSVPISGGGWGGNTQVISNSFNAYLVWKQFPELVDPDMVLKGLNYLYGNHPYNNLSFVTGVGVGTKKVAYGNNRADYNVIPGGIVPGLLMRKPDFMENKDDYPFLWGENECCINTVPNYVMLNLACMEVAAAINK